MNIGFIGIGNIGKPMATNLLKAGHRMKAHDIRTEAGDDLVKAGATWAPSPAEAARGSDVVFTSLPGPKEVEAVALGRDGILEGLAKGAVYVDLSTNSPTLIRKIHAIYAKQGIQVLDAPVSNRGEGAKYTGTLTMMVGGDRSTFERLKPVVRAIADPNFTYYCGGIGNGHVCKICNNIAFYSNALVLTEVLTLGAKAGVPVDMLADIIANGSGSSAASKSIPPRLFKGDFKRREGGSTSLYVCAKDVRLATDLAREVGVPMALANLVDQSFTEAVVRGWLQESWVNVLRLQEERAGVQLRLPV